MIRLIVLTVLLAGVTIAAPGISEADEDSGNQGPAYDDLGFTLGTPGGLNLEWEHTSTSATVAVTGMYWGEVKGIQVGYAPSIARFLDNRARLQFMAGVSQDQVDDDPPDEWTYLGAEIVVRPKRFLLGIGLTVGTGTYSSPQVSGRAGFAWTL